MSKQIKNEDQYEALRDKGMSKEKAARIANADVDHDSRPYEERSRTELYELAKELDIEGRSKMDKSALIKAIRNN
jgi:hypothetical protein